MAEQQQPSPAPVPPPALSRGQIFFRRLFSSVVLWTIVLLAIFSKNQLISDYFFLLIMFILAGFGLVEFYDMARKIGLPCYKGWGIFGGLLLMMATFLYLSGVIASGVTPADANDF
jgi:small-conductance mechanosensitive channel